MTNYSTLFTDPASSSTVENANRYALDRHKSSRFFLENPFRKSLLRWDASKTPSKKVQISCATLLFFENVAKPCEHITRVVPRERYLSKSSQTCSQIKSIILGAGGRGRELTEL